MNIELFDVYNIRARLSASIILLAPVAITLFFCFNEIYSFVTSSIISIILLAFTNYIPIVQRRGRKTHDFKNYAAQLLYYSNDELDQALKTRYYKILAKQDESFHCFLEPNDTPLFKSACENAVVFLRNRSRDNKLVLEENINYGFCTNILKSKSAGIIISILSCALTVLFSYIYYQCLDNIPIQNWFAFFFNVAILLFWIVGVSEKMVETSGRYYARALISSIDLLDNCG